VDLGGFSEPQPDLVLLKPRMDYYTGQIPEATDILLLIEASDTTLAFDRGSKLALYARYGVMEYWIVDVVDERIEVYREPTTRGYLRTTEHTGPDEASPLAFPGMKLSVSTVFSRGTQA
jgi:Uma2 family endonuclease